MCKFVINIKKIIIDVKKKKDIINAIQVGRNINLRISNIKKLKVPTRKIKSNTRI